MTTSGHLLLLAAILAALALSAIRSGTTPRMFGLIIRRAEKPDLFAFCCMALASAALIFAGGALYAAFWR